MPALPLDEAGKYVAGAYVAFAVLLLVYVAIMAARLARLQREIAELADRVAGGRGNGVGEASVVADERRSVGERIAP
jgi:HAMP domain-containing protein